MNLFFFFPDTEEVAADMSPVLVAEGQLEASPRLDRGAARNRQTNQFFLAPCQLESQGLWDFSPLCRQAKIRVGSVRPVSPRRSHLQTKHARISKLRLVCKNSRIKT